MKRDVTFITFAQCAYNQTTGVGVGVLPQAFHLSDKAAEIDLVIGTRSSTVVALFPVSFKVFAWVEDRAFDQRKRRDFGVAEINRIRSYCLIYSTFNYLAASNLV